MRIRAIAMLLLSAAAARGQFTVPRAGCYVDEERRLRPVFGVAGNFLVGEAEAEEVRSAACSDGFSLIKREDSLEVRDRNSVAEWPAPPGPALFGFSPHRAAALVYYPETKEWFRVGGGAMVRLPPPEGEVLAVGTPEWPAAIVRRDGVVRIAGADERPLPEGAAEPLLLLPDGSVLYTRGAELVLAGADGAERSFKLPAAAAALEWMGRGWVRVRISQGGGHLALALADRIELYRLPEVAP